MAYIVYCLVSCSHPKRTYVGVTNNFTRRLRQHNGKLKCGGARYTKSYRPWRLLFRVSGFPDKRTAYQFEWAMKHHRKRARFGGPAGRKRTLERLMNLADKERWTKTAPPMKELRDLIIITAEEP